MDEIFVPILKTKNAFNENIVNKNIVTHFQFSSPYEEFLKTLLIHKK